LNEENERVNRLATFGPNEPRKGKDASNSNFIAPFILNREIVYEMSENWNDGGPKMLEFDILMRKYLMYCQMTGHNVEDYIPGLIQEEIDEHLRSVSRDRS